MEKITYLVANHNHAKYIGTCIESLFEQTSDRWLCIVCDDASSDNSVEIISDYLNENVRLIRNDKNSGYIETLKRLVREAKTDIVGFLDADDALFPEATASMLEVYDKNKHAEFVYSRLRLFDETLIIPKETLGKMVDPDKTSIRSGFITKLFTFRKDAYNRTDGLDNRYVFAEDRDLTLKLEEVTVPIFLDRILYKYRVIPGSQAHDSEKREVGLVSHMKARKEALRRRKIKGLDKMMHEQVMNFDHIEWSNRYGRFTVWSAIFCRRILRAIDMRLNIRSDGELRRLW